MGFPAATGTRLQSIPLLSSILIAPLFLLVVSCASMRPDAVIVDPTAASQAPTRENEPNEGSAGSAEPALEPGADADPTDAPLAAVEIPTEGQGSPDAPSPDDEVAPDEGQVPASHDDLAINPPAPTPEEIERERRLALAPTYDIPMVVNDKVTAWVDFYSGRHKEKFRASLVRSGKYLPMIHAIFAEAGIPKDLAYMAHVESAFKSRAYSKAKAKGMFQFIAGTGRRYGLHADSYIDERSDPEKSARAAAAYLGDLYAEFGDWYLALAAYNAGEGKIRRAIRSTGSTDFWTIAKTSAIRNETKNYVPAILAATVIAKDFGRYGLDHTPDAPLAYEIVETRKSYDLAQIARAAGLDAEALRDLNPELRRGRTPPGRTTKLKIPPGTHSQTMAALDKVPVATEVATTTGRHVVRKGETLGLLAQRYGVSVASIQRANKMGKGTILRAGRSIAIPGLASAELASATRDDVTPSAAPSSYRVRSGDTLSSIARRFGTTPAAIAAANNVPVQGTIRSGETLQIPGRKRAAAGRKASSSETTPAVHTVRTGETLWNIAARYRTSVDRLCDLNSLSQSEPLYPGRKLTIR